MMGLIPFLQTTEDGDRSGFIRFIDHDFLETPFECLIGLEIFLIFVQCRCTDRPQVTPCQRRFEDIGCVHGSAGFTGTYEGMDLIDKEDDLTGCGDHFVHDALQTLFELTLVLGACDEGSHIEGVDLFLFQVLRYVSTHNTMRQAFGDSGLTYTRFTDQDRIVLRSPTQDLEHTTYLVISTDDGV